MSSDLGPLARELSLPYYDDALPAHDQFHAKRVRDVAIRLAADHDDAVDRGVLAAAAWFHDVGRPRERTGEIADHDRWAASEAVSLLDAEPVASDRVEAVEHCVRAHSIRASSPPPETAEAKLLFDADKLDAVGAVGLLRLACIVGERSGRRGEKHATLDAGSTLGADDRPDVTLLRDWARERLDALHTAPARRLGEQRWQFVEAFLDRFRAELGPDAVA